MQKKIAFFCKIKEKRHAKALINLRTSGGAAGGFLRGRLFGSAP